MHFLQARLQSVPPTILSGDTVRKNGLDGTAFLSSDSFKLTLNGRGFDALDTTKNVVQFTPSHGLAVKGLAVLSTMTQLTVSFTHLAPSNEGQLQAHLTVSDWHRTVLQNVTKVVGANPHIQLRKNASSPQLPELTTDAAKITIFGTGFDALDTTANVFRFCSDSGFGFLSPCDIASFRSGGSADDEEQRRRKRQRRRLGEGQHPNSSLGVHNEDNRGQQYVPPGFVAAVVREHDDGGKYRRQLSTNIQLGMPRGLAVQSTMTHLVVSFTKLGPTDDYASMGGVLSAQVVVAEKWWSCNNRSSSDVSECKGKDLFELHRVAPVLTRNQGTLRSDAYKMTIKGTGFDASYPLQNVLSIFPKRGDPITGQLMQASMTQMILSFNHLVRASTTTYRYLP